MANNSLTAENATLSSSNSTLSGADPDQARDFKFNIFGYYVYPSKWLSLQFLYAWAGPLSSVAMVVGCVLPYVPQYMTIHKQQNSTGFSTFVCLTLLISNIMRIAFWFGHPFEYPLIIQSALQILTQILLLELCVRVKRRYAGSSLKKKSLFTSKPRCFWQWTDLASYLEFLCIFVIVLAVTTYLLLDCSAYIESIGYCALVSESMLGLPQVIKNHQNKSVVGMSLMMVLMWLGGDTFKTGYFIVNGVPYQFWLCGVSQITIDLLILFQVCLYRQNAPMKLSPRGDEHPKEMMSL